MYRDKQRKQKVTVEGDRIKIIETIAKEASILDIRDEINFLDRDISQIYQKNAMLREELAMIREEKSKLEEALKIAEENERKNSQDTEDDLSLE